MKLNLATLVQPNSSCFNTCFLYPDAAQRCSIKKSIFKNFAKFTGTHLRQSLLFDKVAGLRPATL